MRQNGIASAIEKRPGVYRLQNIVTGNFYIGSSVNVYKRYYRHKQVLREGLKENIRIKEDCDKHGIESFVFGVIEYCHQKELKEKEQYYFELMNPTYNVWKTIYSAKDREYTEEQLKSFLGHQGPKDIEGFKKKLKDAWVLRRQSPKYQEGIDKMVKGKTGHKHSQESKKKIGLAQKGKSKPEGFGEKLRQIRLNDSQELKDYRALKAKQAKEKIWQTSEQQQQAKR